MDIPDRYAEGYAVPVVDGEWVDVPDYNAHAWAVSYTHLDVYKRQV